MPIGACIATPEVMAAWGQSQGEAIHTSTFLGHPISSAAALASLHVLESMDAPAQAMAVEKRLKDRFGSLIRGRGAMLGVETGHPGSAAKISGHMLKAGYIVLPGGVKNDIVGITPPLVLTEAQWTGALNALEAALAQEGIRP